MDIKKEFIRCISCNIPYVYITVPYTCTCIKALALMCRHCFKKLFEDKLEENHTTLYTENGQEYSEKLYRKIPKTAPSCAECGTQYDYNKCLTFLIKNNRLENLDTPETSDIETTSSPEDLLSDDVSLLSDDDEESIVADKETLVEEEQPEFTLESLNEISLILNKYKDI